MHTFCARSNCWKYLHVNTFKDYDLVYIVCLLYATKRITGIVECLLNTNLFIGDVSSIAKRLRLIGDGRYLVLGLKSSLIK
jgi:hypothetical protein